MKTYVLKEACAQMFSMAFITQIAPKWKHPKCPSIMNGLISCGMLFTSEKNEIRKPTAARTGLDNILLSEDIETTCCRIPVIEMA